MGKAYIEQFNFKNFKGTEQINVVSGLAPLSYLSELSLDGNNNVYLYHNTQNIYEFYLSTNEEEDEIYLNYNLSGICKQLTNLQSTDLLNKKVINYHSVSNMHTSFANCYRLTEKPISAKRVKSMYGTYYNCTNLYGSLYINANVNNMIGTFYNCSNIIGPAQSNENVISMKRAYYNCTNLIGEPACGEKVKTLEDAYYNCYLLEGNPANCNGAIVTANAYYNVPNLYGNFYWMLNNFTQAEKVNSYGMFYNRNIQNKINIYVSMDSGVSNALKYYGDTYGDIYNNHRIFIWDDIITTDQNYIIWNNVFYNTNVIEVRQSFIEENCLNCNFNWASTIRGGYKWVPKGGVGLSYNYWIYYIENIIYDPTARYEGDNDFNITYKNIVYSKVLTFNDYYIDGTPIMRTENLLFNIQKQTIRYRKKFGGFNLQQPFTLIEMMLLPKTIDDKDFFNKMIFNSITTPGYDNVGYILTSPGSLLGSNFMYSYINSDTQAIYPGLHYMNISSGTTEFLSYMAKLMRAGAIDYNEGIYTIKNTYLYSLFQLFGCPGTYTSSTGYNDGTGYQLGYSEEIWNEICNCLQINNDYLAIYNNTKVILNNYPSLGSYENWFTKNAQISYAGSDLLFNEENFYDYISKYSNIEYSSTGFYYTTCSPFLLCGGLKNINLALVNFANRVYIDNMFVGSDLESPYFPENTISGSHAFSGTAVPIENLVFPNKINWIIPEGYHSTDYPRIYMMYSHCVNIWGNLRHYYNNISLLTYEFNQLFQLDSHIITFPIIQNAGPYIGTALDIRQSGLWLTVTEYDMENLIEGYDIKNFYYNISDRTYNNWANDQTNATLGQTVIYGRCPNLIVVNDVPHNQIVRYNNNVENIIDFTNNYIKMHRYIHLLDCKNVRYISNSYPNTILNAQRYQFINTPCLNNPYLVPSLYLDCIYRNITNSILHLNCSFLRNTYFSFHNANELEDVIIDIYNVNLLQYNNVPVFSSSWSRISFYNCINLQTITIKGTDNIAITGDVNVVISLNNCIDIANFQYLNYNGNIITNLEPYKKTATNYSITFHTI